MTVNSLVLIGVAVAALMGAIGAFVVAFRRAQLTRPRPAPRPDPTAGVSAETRAADRSMEGVRLEPLAEEPEVEVEVEVEVEAPVAVHLVEERRIVEVSPEEGGVTRRQFFNRAITATFGSFLALFGLNSLAFFWPKLSGGFGSDIDAGLLSDLQAQVFTPDGAILPLFVPEARAYVVPAPRELSDQFAGKSLEVGGLMALFQRCVHLGCRVPWCGPSQGFECPCHGSKYNAVGEYYAGPAPRNLDRFVVELRGDRFFIRTGSILETPRAPQLSIAYPQGPSCIGEVAAEGEE